MKKKIKSATAITTAAATAAATAIIITQQPPPAAFLPPPAAAYDDIVVENSNNNNNAPFIPAFEGLKAPTPEQPQITLSQTTTTTTTTPTTTSSSKTTPILQGLVYLVDEKRRPYSPADNLVITATTIDLEEMSDVNIDDDDDDDDDDVILGAKIPIATMRFPMTFKMYKENIMPKYARRWLSSDNNNDDSNNNNSNNNKSANEILSRNDFLVTARVCPATSQKLPCRKEESVMIGRGVAKVIRGLPGMGEGDFIRSAASLGLQ